jgi:hypothetical protein
LTASKGWYSVRIQTETICSSSSHVNHEYNWCLDAYFKSDSSDFNLDDDDAHEQIPVLFVKRQTQKADNDTAYASSDWPSVMKQTFLCNFLKYHNSFFSTVIHSSEHNYWQSFFYLILKVFLHTSVRLTLLLWTQLISVTWTVNLFCHKHCHIMTSNSHDFFIVWTQFSKMKRKSRKVNFLIVNNKKVNFSYWLSFLLLSQAHICLSASFLLSSDIFVLSSTLKTRLIIHFLSTTRTESLCWNHHRESLDCRPVRSFVSIHCHQQHHSHQKHWMCCNL